MQARHGLALLVCSWAVISGCMGQLVDQFSVMATGPVEPEDPVQAFVDWLQDQHVDTFNLRLTADPEGTGIGVRVTMGRDVQSKAPIVEIPVAAGFTYVSAMKGELGQAVRQALAGANVTDSNLRQLVAVTSQLLFERCRKHQSPYWPWLALYPNEWRTMPLYFKAEEALLFQMSERAVGASDAVLKEMDGLFQFVLNKVVQASPLTFVQCEGQWQSLTVWATVAMFSRAIHTSDGQWLLMPILDSLPHGEKGAVPDVAHDVLSGFPSKVTLRSSHFSGEGTILFSHGHDCAGINVELKLEGKLADAQLTLLLSNGLIKEGERTIGTALHYGSDIPPAFLMAVRIMSLLPQDFPEFQRVIEGQPASLAHEVRVLRTLRQAFHSLAAKLRDRPARAVRDKLLPAEEHNWSRVQRNIMEVHRGELRTLEWMLAKVKDMWMILLDTELD